MMRQIGLIHGDIKPENIMYSPWQRKVVLVDFGLAKFVEQKLLGKTETWFRGTRGFVGEEMAAITYGNTVEVNLFKNDMEMLAKTLRKLKKGYVEGGSWKKERVRTEGGYFLVSLGEIYDKYVVGKTSYRHIKPSALEEEVGSRVRSWEVVIEQDDTLHEKKYRFEYVHKAKDRVYEI